jgi:hypothetical protein
LSPEIFDVSVKDAISEKVARTAQQCECRRKAAYKNRHRTRSKPTPEQAREAKRLAGTRRDRRVFASFIEAASVAAIDDVNIPEWELPTFKVGCDDYYVIETTQPTLGDIFESIDPRFTLFLHMQDEDEPVEQIGEIIAQPDFAGLTAYASLGAYARQQASYAD